MPEMDKKKKQHAWALIKKMVFKPQTKDQKQWVKQLNRYLSEVLEIPISISHKDLENNIKLNFIQISPQISDKSSLIIHSKKFKFEYNLHFDPTFVMEGETESSGSLSKILTSQEDVLRILENYIAHPAIHIHLPKITYEQKEDALHEIRIASGSENFFYLMYQIFFQTIDFRTRYDNSNEKKKELTRLAAIIWKNKAKVNIGPGDLFPTKKQK